MEEMHRHLSAQPFAWQGFREGLHYWEVRIDNGGEDGGYFYIYIGVSSKPMRFDNYYPSDDSSWINCWNGGIRRGSQQLLRVEPIKTAGDRVGVLLDLNRQTLTFYRNGRLFGEATKSLTDGQTYFPYVGLCRTNSQVTLLFPGGPL